MVSHFQWLCGPASHSVYGFQKISDQIQLDEDTIGLLDAIDQTLDLAPDADSLRMCCESSKNHQKTLLRMLEQISECGYFIQSYVKDVNFCKSFIRVTLVHILSCRLFREALYQEFCRRWEGSCQELSSYPSETPWRLLESCNRQCRGHGDPHSGSSRVYLPGRQGPWCVVLSTLHYKFESEVYRSRPEVSTTSIWNRHKIQSRERLSPGDSCQVPRRDLGLGKWSWSFITKSHHTFWPSWYWKIVNCERDRAEIS